MRIVKRALGVLLISVLASSLSVLTTGFVVNAYIQSVLSSFDMKLDSPVSGITGILSSITGSDNKSKSTETTESSGDSSGSGQSEPGDDKSLEDALPVMGEAAEEAVTSEGQSGSALDQQLVMTPEAMRDLKENLPSEEKVDIFNILMTKLPQEEMQKISTAMEDGLTESEVKEIQEVIAKYVDKEEYDVLMKMLTPTSTAIQ
ncbi:hypothetical protein PaeBR_23655 [Paenibacillus sp. BR2-3]|uniref:hypothetical protein n=1 Tax=Paenibacillus sp. BR2-3 TaxID=3048494 RepID=UPI0039775FC5